MLHFVGALRHRVYLAHWGVDAGSFPKTVDWLLINGYYGLFDQFSALLKSLVSNWYWLLAAAVVSALHIATLGFASDSISDEPPAWLMRHPRWVRLAFGRGLLTALLFCLAPLVLFLVVALMIVPAALGERAGLSSAAIQDSEFKKGCEKSKRPCVQLVRNGSVVATGFVLDDSLAQIALYDPSMQRARILPRDGLEVISERAP